ncbi:hypothetical protein T12_12561 [Trichinella patagoniensis]|uniref:Uncharacterized protein n=1 Tax=Trichinella patagoniensis TaxID=990121 RepID=A0A0V0ZGB4_9BILA|nr:hypothetical protein T12_6639 [Trichinella patagoniensis]KRY11590.1 hypothetical protein T12_12561 [Trichinella patagoniensis]
MCRYTSSYLLQLVHFLHRTVGAFVAKRRGAGIDRWVSLFLYDSGFPDGNSAIKQQSVSIVFIGNCEQGPSKMRYSKLLRPHNNERAHVHPYYCTEPLIFKSKSAYGGFTFLPLRSLEE